MYALLDSNDQLVNGQPVQIFRKPKAEVINGIQYPRTWWTAYSLTEKAAIHVYPIQVINNVGQYQQEMDRTYTFDGSHVIETISGVDNDIDQIRQVKLNETLAHAYNVRDSGFIFEGEGFGSDQRDIAIVGLLFSGVNANTPFNTNFGIRNKAGTAKHPLPTSQARKGFSEAIISHLDQVNEAYDEHFQYITDPARTVQELKSHDVTSTITTPWPTNPSE